MSPPSRNQWMQKSMLRRLVPPVKNTVDDIIENDSPFLQTPPNTNVAVFARHEIQINSVPIGTGGFSNVHEIVGFELDEAVTARCDQVQRNLRQIMQDQLYDENGTPRFVVKHLKKQLLEHPNSYQCALRDLVLEVEYMSRLSHDNILPLLGRPIDGIDACQVIYDGFFLITERLETTLTYRIKEWNVSENPPSAEERVQYMEQLGEALAYLHEQRIVFRDLKPDNIGLSSSNRIKLFDFGLCRQLPDDMSIDRYEMSGVGTQRYMSSEVLSGSPYNCKADVYSWSLLFWEVVSGVRPYLRYGNKQHRAAVLYNNERPKVPSHWPAYLHSLLSRCWCRGIDDRYDMHQALAVLKRRHAPQRRPAFVMKKSARAFLREQILSAQRLSPERNTRVRLSSVHLKMGFPAAA